MGVILILFFNQKNTKSVVIETIKPKIQDISQTVSASGKVKSDEEANLTFQTAGQLAWVGVKKGDSVKKWEEIATLDQRALKKNLQKYLNDYFTQRTNFDDDQKTYEVVLTDFIKRIRQRSQGSLDNSVLDVEFQDLSIKLSSLVTPIAGIVTRADAETAGVNVNTTTAWTISNPDKIIFNAEIDESDVGKVQEGQEANITLDSFPDKKINGTIGQISYVSHLTSSGATAYDAKIAIENRENLRFGMNGDVSIITDKKFNVLTLPISAVYEKDNKKYVTTYNNKVKQEVEIKTGIESDDDVEITNGLSASDEVITNGGS